MTYATALAIALILDAAAGEPRVLWSRVPHPAIILGHAVGWLDKGMNDTPHQRLKGVVAIVLLASGSYLIGAVIERVSPGQVLETLIAAILLAQRSLAQHVGAVADALRLSLSDGRRAVAHIVGRDTASMDRPAVSRAAIESAAENLSDGVVAPALFFLFFGLPGMLVYKVVNTADSMIGYRTPRHEAFGWAAARLDDVLNWIPARVTAYLIAIVSGALRHWPQIAQDSRLHRSPNAGWPEAALANGLGVALAGPRSYQGQMRTFPWVNESGARDIGSVEIDGAVRMLWRTWGLFLAIVIVLAVI